MNNFEYHKPASADEAAKLLSAGATALAGGMTLLPAVKQGLATPSALADLSEAKELQGIREDAKRGVVIGAMVTHAEVAASSLVREKIPALAKLAANIGDPQVRHRGTCGGSLANNDPAADYPAGLLGLGGSVHTNKRTIDAAEFFSGLFTTALDEGEIILHVHFDIPEKAIYMKFPQPASRYALVGIMLAKTANGVRAAVTGAGDDGVFRATDIENALSKDFSAAALADVKISADGLMGDMHGSADYRAHLITVLAKRALA
ncbi:MAG: FAD binding domain-containing protein [Gammaproteobacteria bacterium WSBS_2016_MAG_OTU1]